MMDEIMTKEAYDHLSRDAKFRPYLKAVTLPERTPAADVYAGLLSSIVSQQLSIKAASTIHGRFLALFASGYPDADALIVMPDDQLRSAGLSRQKARYVKCVAEFFLSQVERKLLPEGFEVLFNDITLKDEIGSAQRLNGDWRDLDWNLLDDESIIDVLTQIKGVGRWTVEMILMFVLQRQDVFPLRDLGVQQGVKHVYQFESEKNELYIQMLDIAKKWRPYRTLACLYLWEIDKTRILQ